MKFANSSIAIGNMPDSASIRKRYARSASSLTACRAIFGSISSVRSPICTTPTYWRHRISSDLYQSMSRSF
ncbi:MAG: hypothetical protein IPI24_13510 [Ignavibacteria bacterium]|nr:hypothetical protein [Ignavibacteria bacterium]